MAASVVVPVTRPGPGSGTMSSTVQDDRLDAGLAQLDRLVVGEPGRGVDGALLERGRLAVVRVLDDRDVVGGQVRRRRAGPGA